MIKLKNGLYGLTPTNLAAKANELVAKMTGNANFPTPSPDLAVITAKEVELTTLIGEAAGGDRYKIAARNVAYDELVVLLKLLADYVTVTAAGNGLIILSSGFGVSSTSRQPIEVEQPETLVPMRGNKSGEIHLKWDSIRGAKSYLVQQTETDPSLPETVWQPAGICTRSKISISGLTPGQHYWFRVKTVGSQNESAFSDVALIMAA